MRTNNLAELKQRQASRGIRAQELCEADGQLTVGPVIRCRAARAQRNRRDILDLPFPRRFGRQATGPMTSGHRNPVNPGCSVAGRSSDLRTMDEFRRDSSCAYWPSLPSLAPDKISRFNQCSMTAVVSAYRCGAVPASHQVPSFATTIACGRPATGVNIRC